MVDMSVGEYDRFDVLGFEGKSAVDTFCFFAVSLENTTFKKEFLFLILEKM